MSSSAPPPLTGHMALEETVLPYGRPVRRRIALPLTLVIGVALVLTLVILHDPVVYYRVDSGSMRPTLPVGSRVSVEPGLTPRVGEIIAFHAPAGAVPANPVCGASGEGAGFSEACGRATPVFSRVVFIKRIVAGPGESVSIRDGRAVVDGVTSTEGFAATCYIADCNFPEPVRVPRGDYFVLGDNRATSDDSRFWGPIPARAILGVLVTCQPLQTACQPRH